MTHHKKDGNKKMPTLRQEVIHNPIPTSLFHTSLSSLAMYTHVFITYERFLEWRGKYGALETITR